MSKKRAYKKILDIPEGHTIVSMVKYNEHIIMIATENAIFVLGEPKHIRAIKPI